MTQYLFIISSTLLAVMCTHACKCTFWNCFVFIFVFSFMYPYTCCDNCCNQGITGIESLLSIGPPQIHESPLSTKTNSGAQTQTTVCRSAVRCPCWSTNTSSTKSWRMQRRCSASCRHCDEQLLGSNDVNLHHPLTFSLPLHTLSVLGVWDFWVHVFLCASVCTWN